jgi:aconitate hydratase
MGDSLTRKILESHLVEGRWTAGEEIGVRIDQTLTQDATGTMAYLQFEAMGIPRVRTELSVSYVDHNTIQIGFENADDHRYLQSVARRYGLHFSRPGNGICHQVHLERFGRPGRTLLGADSHTPTGGGLGMVAMGAGGLDVAMAMGGAPFYLTCPQVVGIHLTGRLPDWVSAKDVILKVLEMFGTKGNVGCVFEYHGPGVESLSVPERATITNMGAECGVTTSVFPSDEVTRAFLRAQGREQDWVEVTPDSDADYAWVVEVDLGGLEPLAAAPHSPGNVEPVRALAGLKVDQVCLGSCTNSSYTDLVRVARMLAGRTVHPDVSCVITPGSKQVVQTIARDGHLAALIAAGARLVEPSCGFCIGNSQSPGSGAVSLRTSNRNFEARSGTRDARVYLVSPETAAAAVLTGVVTDPRDLGLNYPRVEMPDSFVVEDNLIIRPEETPNPAGVAIERGPNIGEPLVNPPLPGAIDGVVAIKVGDRITTDHIIPAGARMKYRSNIKKYSEFVFENVDSGFAQRAAGYRDQGLHNVIVAGESYGQGSSREHASICPSYLGVKIVLARSFERIHAANLVNFGIVPLTFVREGDYDAVEGGDRLEFAGVRRQVAGETRFSIQNRTRGTAIEVSCDLTERQRRIVLAGGALSAGQGRTG